MSVHEIDDGEAMSGGGVDVSYLIGRYRVLDMQQDPQRSAFNAYRTAFRANQAEPNLPNAAELVRSWNALADIMGLARA